VLGLVFGVLGGAAIAMLFAPQSGQELRAELQARARQAGEEGQKKLQGATAAMEQKVGKAKAPVEETIG
jgi:gas vesicle protein